MNKITAVNIKVNGLINPVGITCGTPEFSWQISDAVSQSAYRIAAAETSAKLKEGNYCFDTGIVKSSCMSGILWGGAAVPGRCRIFFKIELFDENGTSGGWSEPCFFETAPADESEFDAQWVGFPAGWSGHALCFRKVFDFAGEIKNARLYVAGGIVKSFLNGKSLDGTAVLHPAITDYGKSYHVLTFDVTDVLNCGKNTLFFHAGSGWYGMPILKYRLEVDGKVVTCSHALSLPMVCKSPVSRHSIYGGEEYDARGNISQDEELPANKAALRIYGPVGNIRGFEEEFVTPQEEILPVSWKRQNDNSYVVDFGRNFTGWCRLKTVSPAGRAVTMRFAEQLYPDGRINQENLQGDYSTDVYTACGNAEGEVYEPSFTFHGFRYVEISGLSHEPQQDTLTGVVLRSGCRRTGYFKCSNDLLNRIFEMMLHTEESNLLAVPTDCPQRTERMGWLNDMMARNEGALYLFDAANIYIKYLSDIVEAQEETGNVPMTAPFYWGFDIDPVCSSFLEIARNSRRFCGKTSQLYQLYPAMLNWVRYMKSCCDADGILRQGGFVGDWCPPLCFNGEEESPQNKSVPHGLVSTALMYYAAKLLIEIAQYIDKKDDIAELEELLARSSSAFRTQFVSDFGRLKIESQAAYSIAVYCGLFADKEACSAAERLAEIFAANNFKHTTGNICSKYLLDVLSQYGYIDHVMKLVASDTYPGWGYMLANNATTVWERWEKDDGKRLNSLNHPMHSAPCVWMFRHLAGIKLLPESVGANVVELSPEFPQTLDYVEAAFDSCAGKYSSKWQRKDGNILWDFTIPANCCANVRMADGSFKKYFAGSYRISLEM